jgi:Bacterial PH domain
VAAAVAAGLAATSDAAGQLLFALLALWLAALVAADLLLRPRLRADVGGLSVRTLSVRARLPWSAVQRVQVDQRSRYGLTARALEVDAGDVLVVLGRRSLGADPRDVASALEAIRYGHFRPS